MNYVATRMINIALEQVESDDEAAALAELIMQMTKGSTADDPIHKMAEHKVLTVLIEETAKKASEKNLSNIFALMRGDFESDLSDNQNWIEFKNSTTEHFRACAMTGLEIHLAPFRILSMVS